MGKKNNIQWAAVLYKETPGWLREVNKQKGYINSDYQSVQFLWAEEHLGMCNMLNLQQEKTTLVPIVSLKNRNQRSPKVIWQESQKLLAITQIPGLNLPGGGYLMVWGMFPRHTLGPLIPVSSYLYTITAHSNGTTSGTIKHHDTNVLTNWFRELDNDNEFNISSDLLSPRIWIRWNTFQEAAEWEIHSMKERLKKLQELCDAIMSTCNRVSKECLQYLVESMPWRTEALLTAKEGPSIAFLIKCIVYNQVILHRYCWHAHSKCTDFFSHFSTLNLNCTF